MRLFKELFALKLVGLVRKVIVVGSLFAAAVVAAAATAAAADLSDAVVIVRSDNRPS